MVDGDLDGLRARTRALCARFPDEYWRETDRDRRYPHEFVDALTAAGLLAALIPTGYGGLGLGLREASVIMEEINKSGGHSAACHAQMYTMGALLRHGSDHLKSTYLPPIATGELRLQAFSVTEPGAGSATTSIVTSAERDGEAFVLTGHKNWTSRIAESDLALVLARTSSKTDDRTRGLTLFLVDLRRVRAEQPEALEVEPVRTMFNYATYQVHYRGLRVAPVSNNLIKAYDPDKIAVEVVAFGLGIDLLRVENANRARVESLIAQEGPAPTFRATIRGGRVWLTAWSPEMSRPADGTDRPLPPDVAVADLIPGLHRRVGARDSVAQVLLIGLGVGVVALVEHLHPH